ncbi:MAG: hypothetical protein A2104_00440 [Candidatus Melainabacteria bacterium GWF2_32_7]|nr:MAG: hypothetical protein A2104_00440 [Candidatus Melainabacteria bacterium GWF2_32_7]
MDTVMEINGEQKLVDNEKIFSPSEVRKLLNTDNQEIQRLCKEVSVFPKKDNSTGRIFFFKNDVEVLKKIKDLYDKTQKVLDQKRNGESTALALAGSSIKPISDDSGLNAIVNTVVDARDDIVKRLTSIIDEKLEGIDDVVVELIKCKVENEKLRMKIDQVTKDNYNLMGDLNKFKPVGLGLYKKTKSDF